MFKRQQIGSPFQFFGIETFIRKFVFLQRVPFQLRQKCWQFRKCLPFSASGPRRATQSIFLVFRFSSTVNWHLEVLLLFLSLGYGADLGRSRLVFNTTRFIRSAALFPNFWRYIRTMMRLPRLEAEVQKQALPFVLARYIRTSEVFFEHEKHLSGVWELFWVFRSRKKFSTTYAIVLFFSPDLFMKISNFSKTVHTIFTKFCPVILHPKGLLRVQRHQNRMAGMWET